MRKKGHTDKKQNEQNERQIKIEKHPDCKFFHKLNPDAEGFDIFVEISKIHDCITQSNKEKLKELENIITDQEDKIKEFSISMPLKHIRYFVKKILPTLQI